MENNYFTKLNDINVSGKVEKKNGLSYLSWVYAWGEIKKQFPKAQNKVYENAQGWNYFTDGRTCWVKVGVIIEDIEHIEYLPVMDARNRSIPLESVTSFDVNKAIQRAMTKACARHGLGLYVYAGEDLPESERDSSNETPTEQQIQQLKRINRTLGNVAKCFDIDEKAVTAKHVEDYLKKAAEYQKAKSEKVEKEAEELFTSNSGEE